MKKSLLTVFGAAVLAVASSGIANASITVALTTDVAGVYTYGISVDSLEQVNNTSYFTIYDFAGYVAGSAFAPTGWTVAEQATGKTPATVSVPDSGLTNLTFSYVGPPSTLAGGSTVNGFGADSNAPSQVLGWFSYQAIKSSTGTIDQGDGNLEVPVGTPEPMSMSLLGGGLALLGALRLRKKA